MLSGVPTYEPESARMSPAVLGLFHGRHAAKLLQSPYSPQDFTAAKTTKSEFASEAEEAKKNCEKQPTHATLSLTEWVLEVLVLVEAYPTFCKGHV